MNEQKILKQFTEQIKMQFDVFRISIYKDGTRVCGDAIDTIDLDQYTALTCTTVFSEPSQSRIVTHIHAGASTYIVMLESKNTMAFYGLDQAYMIAEFKKLKRKLGELA